MHKLLNYNKKKICSYSYINIENIISLVDQGSVFMSTVLMTLQKGGTGNSERELWETLAG